MSKLSCGPPWKEKNKWENVGYVLYSLEKIFGPYFLVGGPTLGFVHGFAHGFGG